MNATPFEDACWIAPSEPSASPIIERTFQVESADSAALTVTGLGYFEARVNGYKLGNEYFQPVVSDYEPRDTTLFNYPCHDLFSHRIYYRTFDISSFVVPGQNRLEIQLGGGWYAQLERTCEGKAHYGTVPKCIYALQVDGLTYPSDGTEAWVDSDICYSNLYIGECHDPNAPKKSGQVQRLPAPQAELCPQIGSPDRHIRTIIPRLVGEVNGRKIYDAGENISGIVRVRSVAGYTGEIVLRFSEDRFPDGSLDFESTGGGIVLHTGKQQIMTDTFVCDGQERIYEPKFVWHAFRYFDISGECENPEVLVIHADIPVTATFDSDSEALNFLFDAYIRTQLGNMHGSIPSDCPHRERLGYTGDGQITAPAVMMLLDSQEFYRKWIRDILDSQDLKTGHVQHTAPFQGGGGGPGGWGCAIVIVPYWYWRQWDDRSMLETCWEPMCRWIDYLRAHSENGLVTSEVEGGWCLGDWCTYDACRIPEPFVNTFYLIKSIRMMYEIAGAIGQSTCIPGLQATESEALAALKRTYYDTEHGVYFDGTQGADAYAVELGLQSPAICAEYYANLKRFDTGFLGTDVLCDMLFTHGYADLAYQLLSTEECGSYLYMKRHGATTLWESWTGKWPNGEGEVSRDHPMFGAATRQLFQGILGIRQAPDSCGWKQVVITPQLPSAMNYASGSILTPQGRIAVALTRDEKGVCAQVTIPHGVHATASGQPLSDGENTFYTL